MTKIIYLDQAVEKCINKFGVHISEVALVKLCKQANLPIATINGRKAVQEDDFDKKITEALIEKEKQYENRRRNISLGSQRYNTMKRIGFQFLEMIVSNDGIALNNLTFLINQAFSNRFKAINNSVTLGFVREIRLKEQQRSDRNNALGSRFTAGSNIGDYDYSEREQEMLMPIPEPAFIPTEPSSTLTGGEIDVTSVPDNFKIPTTTTGIQNRLKKSEEIEANLINRLNQRKTQNNALRTELSLRLAESANIDQKALEAGSKDPESRDSGQTAIPTNI